MVGKETDYGEGSLMFCEDIDHGECTDHVVDIKEKGKGINTG